jgi:peptide/nickel transport system permease protein
MGAHQRHLCDMEAAKILHPEGRDAQLPLRHKGTHSAVRRLWRDRAAFLGLAVIVCTALAAVFAPELSPTDPIKNNLLERLTPPMWSVGGTSSYPLGTDTLGRDVLSRLLYGARISLLVGVSAVAMSSVLGISLGLIAGYYGGWLDDVLMRLGDIQLAFPILVLAIAVLAVLGASLGNVILVLGISGWITFARLARGETLSLKAREFVEAARAIGVPDRCILWQHILPNVLSSITVVATFSVARVIIAEASLSFLGLGVPPPTPSWGAMLDEGRNYLTTAWWLALFPGLAILILVLGINLVGDWVRDILDPRMERGM